MGKIMEVFEKQFVTNVKICKEDWKGNSKIL
jgi:hypothetical protein